MTSDINQLVLSAVAQLTSGQSRQFSIFDMLGQSSRELTHSTFIAQMLNPNGIHGMGSLFLSLFLKHLPVKFAFQIDSVEVEIEKDYGPKVGSGKDAKGGRIDIFLRDSYGRIIVIENKIYASDQEDQLQRYRNSISEESKEVHILYLTLDGHKPSYCSETLQYCQISYKKEILGWLEDCRADLDSSNTMQSIISQYMTTINTLISDQQVIETLQKSSQNLKASLQIAKLADKARQNLKVRFLTILGNLFNQANVEVTQIGKEFILNTDGCDWCIEHNLFIRFHHTDNEKIQQWRKEHGDSSEETPNWIYVKIDSDLINLQDYNESASLWLDNPVRFWKRFEKSFLEIKDTFGLKYNFNQNKCFLLE